MKLEKVLTKIDKLILSKNISKFDVLVKKRKQKKKQCFYETIVCFIILPLFIVNLYNL